MPLITTVWPALLPVGGAKGERWVKPLAAGPTEPWTTPIGVMPVIVTVNEQIAVWGVASSFDAVTSTVYVPGATAFETEMVADAVPPSVDAGDWLVIAIVPGAGEGEVDAVKPSTMPSGSVAVTDVVAVPPWTRVTPEPQLTATGSFGGGGPTSCEPRPSKVFCAKPVHSTAGSNTFPPSVSPASMEGLRRRVLSAVLTSPAPHSVPGSKPSWPIASTTAAPLRSWTASSPFQKLVDVSVWSAWARTAGSAVACAYTYTSPAATVPVRLI